MGKEFILPPVIFNIKQDLIFFMIEKDFSVEQFDYGHERQKILNAISTYGYIIYIFMIISYGQRVHFKYSVG